MSKNHKQRSAGIATHLSFFITLGMYALSVSPAQGQTFPTKANSVEVQVTSYSAPNNGVRPAVKNGYISWTRQNATTGATDVFVYNIASQATTQITTDGTAFLQAMDGNTVVYADIGASTKAVNIWAFNVLTKTTTQLTFDSNGIFQLNPSISGNRVVWDDSRNPNVAIFGIPLTGGSEFAVSTPAGGPQHHPSISGTLVAWQDERFPVHCSVYAVNLDPVTNAPGTEIAVSNTVESLTPRVDGNHIVYAKQVATSGGLPIHNIFVWDAVTKTESRVSPCNCDQQLPRISGNRIVWADNRNLSTTGWDLYGADLSTGQTDILVDTEPRDQILHDIDGTNVVFSDTRTGTENVFLLTTQACTPPPAGMVSWWPGNGNANDAADGNNGTLVNGATFAPGLVGQAFSLNGVNQYVSVPDAPNLSGMNQLTVDAWVMFNALPAGKWQFIVSKGEAAGFGTNSYDIWFAGDTLRIEAAVESATALNTVTWPNAILPSVWYHLAFTYDGTAIKLYLNGVLSPSVATGVSGPVRVTNFPVFLGRRTGPGVDGNGDEMNGLIDEVEIYNRALTQTEIQAIFNAGSAGKCPLPGDFSLSSIPPVSVSVGGSASTMVTVNSLNGFNSSVALSVSGSPSGVSASFNPASVTPPSGSSASSALNVSVGPSVTPSTFSLTVTGTSGSLTHSTTVSVTVTADTSSITSVIGNLLSAGCIDISGIGTALTSKLSAAQAAISAGNIPMAVNILTALKNQLQAQSGKHIATSCTIGGVTFNPVSVLLSDVQSLIDSLRTTITPNPITGFVVNSSGLGIAGASVSILDSANNTVATATTDITGFYFFPTTGVLIGGASYTVKVAGFPSGFTMSTPPSQTFTWQGAGIALGNFMLS